MGLADHNQGNRARPGSEVGDKPARKSRSKSKKEDSLQRWIAAIKDVEARDIGDAAV